MKFPSLKNRLKMALAEDQAGRDVTSAIFKGILLKNVDAHLISNDNGVFCGSSLIRPLFGLLDPRIQVKQIKKDGARIRKGQTLARLRGKAKAILGAERTFLNLVAALSGIATETRRYVDQVQGTDVRVADTRKTTPLWRDLEKYAVHCGGGMNHRMSLADAILVKDNHVAFAAKNKLSLATLLGGKKRSRSSVKFVEIEASTHRDVWNAIKARPDVIMLDNMTPAQIRGAVKLIRAARKALETPKPFIEISGGVNIKNIRNLARLGCDWISVGALTHSAPALDLSLEVKI